MAEKSVRQYQEEIKTIRRQLVNADHIKAENLRMIEELRENQKLYTVLADNNPDWVLWLDPDDRLVYISPACRRLTGYEPEEFKKDMKLLFKIIHPDDREAFDEHLRFVHKSKGHAEEEFRIIRKDRKTRWISHICQSVYDIEGRFAGVLSSNRDITETRNEQPAFPESTKFYRLIAENMGDVVWTMNLDLQMTYVSPSVSLLRGYPAQEALEQNLGDALTEASLKKFNEVWTEEMAQETPGKVFYNRSLILPLEFQCKDGSAIWTETRITPLRDEDKRIVEILGVSRDITELRQAQENLISEEAKLRQSESRLKALLNAATESIFLMDSKGRVLFANEKTAQYLGTRLETLLAEGDVEKYLKPEAAAKLREHIQQVHKSAKPVHFQQDLPDRIISSSIYPAIGEDGSVSALAVFSLDITDRRNSDAELAESAKLLKDAQSESSRLESRLRKTEIEMGEIQNLLEEAENISKQFEDKLKQTENRLLDNQILLAEAQKKSTQLESRLRETQTRLSENRNMLDANESRLTKGEINLKQVENKLHENRNMLSEAEKKIRQLESQLSQEQDRLRERENQLGTTADKLKLSESRLRQAEASLAEGDYASRLTENRLRALADAVTEAIFLVNEDGRTHLANEAAAACLGTDMPSLQAGQSIFDLLPKQAVEKYKKYAATVLQTGRPAQYEDELNDRMFLNSLYPVTSPEDRAVQVAVFAMDITERRRTAQSIEENLRLSAALEGLTQSEARYRDLFENNNMPVLLIDPSGASIIEANDAAVSFSGLSRQELYGKKLPDFTGLSSRETVRQINAVLTGKSRHVDLKYKLADGSVRDVELFGAPAQSDGKTMLYATLYDITGRGLTGQSAPAQQKTDTGMQALEILAEDIAREFNNLMTVVQGNIDIALFALPESDDAGQSLQYAQDALEKTRELSGRLISLSGVEETEHKPRRIRNILSEAAEGVTDACGIELILDLPYDLWPAEADPEKIRHCFAHLVDNAREAMPEGGTLIIRAENVEITHNAAVPLAEGPYLKINFEDTGTGIAADHVNKIFDPYFSTAKTGKNRGLGLAICHAVFKKHGGYITVNSGEGRGATFIVYLPAAPGAVVEDQPPFGNDSPQPKRILVMDDHEEIRKVLEAYIKKLGFDATSVSDGITALQVYQEALEEGDAFNAVLMELSVKQGLGGRETLARLKNFDPDVKAVAILSDEGHPGAREYLDSGFKGVLGKPFRLEEMKKILSELV
jgi:PAS domain S-box-containing protein